MLTPPTRLSTRAPPRIIDHRIVIAVLVVFGVVLIGLIIYTTVCLKKRRSVKSCGPSEGTFVDPEHLAAQITPFGGRGPHGGSNAPRFVHTPGEGMRIAFRQPDGSWHFGDSLTPFAPEGVNMVDPLPSPSSSASEFFLNTPAKEKKVQARYEPGSYKPECDSSIIPIAFPPPAYHCES